MARVDRYLADSIDLVDQTADRVRNMMTQLRPPMLDDYGLVATLTWYVRQFSDRLGIEANVQGHEPVPRLPSSLENALFRIATEALTNISKHACASRVTISLETDDERVRMVIADDGIGFDAERPFRHGQDKGWGLVTMSERAESVGGRLLLDSSPSGNGTRVIAEVPR